jgi:hypothetical protein
LEFWFFTAVVRPQKMTDKKTATATNDSVPAFDTMTAAQFEALKLEEKKVLAAEISKHHTAHMRAMLIAWACSPGSKVVLAHANGIYESPLDALKQCMIDASQVVPFMDTFTPFMKFLGDAMKKYTEESKTQPNLRLLVILDEIAVTYYVSSNGRLSANRKMNRHCVSTDVLDVYKKDPVGTRAEMAKGAKTTFNKMF